MAAGEGEFGLLLLTGFVYFAFFRHKSQLGLHAGVDGPIPMHMLTKLTELSGFCLLVFSDMQLK